MGGQKNRGRPMTQAAKHGGKACAGNQLETIGCLGANNCGGYEYCSWTDWAPWTDCSATCGEGITRHRRSLAPTNTNPDDKYLAVTALAEQVEKLRNRYEFMSMVGTTAGAGALFATAAAVAGVMIS